MKKGLMKIRKAVIPAAGLGTRFLPFTKAVPKEMLPIIDKPAIHYVVEEAVRSGIERILIVTSRGKEAIGNYFDRNPELERHLEGREEAEALAELDRLIDSVEIHTVRQRDLDGLGGAVAAARSFVGDESFALLLPDTVIDGPTPALGQLIECRNRFGGGVIGLTEVRPDQTRKYGIAAGEEIGPGVLRLEELVEKPAAGFAPSNLAIACRYVLPARIFDFLARGENSSGERHLTNALDQLRREEGLFGLRLQGRVFDLGDKSGFLEANWHFARRRTDLLPEMAESRM